jgi:hypothetical protein
MERTALSLTTIRRRKPSINTLAKSTNCHKKGVHSNRETRYECQLSTPWKSKARSLWWQSYYLAEPSCLYALTVCIMLSIASTLLPSTSLGLAWEDTTNDDIKVKWDAFVEELLEKGDTMCQICVNNVQ